jgi:hypothetical protein
MCDCHIRSALRFAAGGNIAAQCPYHQNADLIVSAPSNGKTHRVDILQNILASLVELDDAVKSMPTASPKPNLLPLFARIDELTKQLPRDADPTLLHYLHRKSYEKARLFLQDRDAENQIGNCRHV